MSLKHYTVLRNLTENILENFSFGNFLVADQCLGVQTIQNDGVVVTWPTTQINHVSPRPREGWCLDNQGAIINRLCEGNFVDGAQWTVLNESCNIISPTNMSLNLTNIISANDPEKYIDEIIELAQNYEKFEPRDIYLFSEFLRQFSNKSPLVFNSILEIINNIGMAPVDILKKSQMTYQATDRILDIVGRLKDTSNSTTSILNPKVAVISTSFDYQVYHTLEVSLKFVSFSIAFSDSILMWNSSDIFQLIINETVLKHVDVTQRFKIIVTLHNDTSFFNGFFDEKSSSAIVSIHIPEIQEEVEATLVYPMAFFDEPPYCSNWVYEIDKTFGYWNKVSTVQTENNRLVCKFSNLKNFGLVIPTNITNELKYLMESSISSREKSNRLSTLIKSYSKFFQVQDVVHVAKILSGFSPVQKEDELNVIADIFDGLIDIDKGILEEVQVEFGSTNTILASFDYLLSEYENSMGISRKNFYISILSSNHYYRNEFIIKDCENYCTIDPITEANGSPNDAEIIVSVSSPIENRKSDPNSKAVMTVFSKNPFFVSERGMPRKNRSKIVGILFPKMYNADSMNITYSYRFDNRTYNHSCEIWQEFQWIHNSSTSPKFHDGFHSCYHRGNGYTALFSDKVDTTIIMEEILNSNQLIEILLEKTVLVLQTYYREFEAEGIHVITKILRKVTKVNKNIIQLCVNIINSVMNIQKKVLKESQVKFRATDQILGYFWKIVKLMDYDEENYTLVYPNIGLTVFSLERNGPIGVEITKFETTYTFDLLWEKPMEKRNITSKSTTIALSQALKDEILNNPSSVSYKIIVAMLLNDALFNEPNDNREVGPIFELAIPKYNTSLKHGIFYHRQDHDYGKKGKCAYWNDSENTNGSWEIWGPFVKNSTCRFFRQGYFSVISEDYFNVTEALKLIRASVVPDLKKLEETENISYLYDQFKPIDLKLLFEILGEVVDLDKRSLDVIKRVADNIFAISSSILNQSQIDYGVLNIILDIINRIGKYLDTNVFYNVSKKFSVLVCSVNESVGIAFNGSLSCLRPEHMEKYYTAKLVLSKTLINHIIVDASGTDDLKIIFSVFYDNVLFVDEENLPTTYIFGLAISYPEKKLNGDISFFYTENEFYNLPLTCSYWKYQKNNLGRWVEVRTSEISSYKSCLYRSAGYFALVKKSPKNLTELLQNIQQDTESYTEKLNELWNILFGNKDTIEPSHVFIMSTILNSHEVGSDEVLMLIGDIISLMMDFNRTVLIKSQQQYSSTDWILHSVDTLIANYQGTTSLLFTNLAIVISSNIVGIAFKRNYDNSWMMEVISTEFSYEKLADVDALLVVDRELQNQIQQTSSSIKIIVFFNDALFQGKYNYTRKNVGIIVGATLSDISEVKLTGHIQILYKSEDIRTDTCAYWRYTTNEKRIESTSTYSKPTCSNLMSVCESELDGSYFALLKMERNITNQLEDILNSSRPVANQLGDVSSILENHFQYIKSYDVFLIGEIVGKLVDEPSITLNQTTVVSKIVSHLFHVNKSVLRKSQQQHQATDRILYYIDNILKKFSDNVDSRAIIQDHFTIIRYDLKNTSIVGVMLSSCNDKYCAISALTDKMNMTEISENENFNMALILSEDLRQQIDENSESVQLVTSIFFNDDFFNENSQEQYTTSKIFGVLLTGLKNHMTAKLSLIYNSEKHQVFDSNSCAFWNYLTDEENFIGGSWEKEVGQKETGKTIICEFKHITHFVLLLAESEILDKATEHILDIITNINSVLSLLGLFGILLTTVLFDRWRNNTGNQILINFTLAVSIKNVMLYISVGVFTENGTGIGCSITGAILHYSILAEFCWMLIIAILQFKRFVEVLGGPLKYVLLKACICGWVFPALPVFLVIIIDVHNYSRGQLHLCYPSGLWLYVTVWLPLLIIVVINSVIFSFIIYNVFHNKTVSRDQTNHEILFQWRLALLLFTMLGLTWLFGFLGLLSVSKVCLVLFSFLASLQGFLMFLFFIVFNKSTRFLYTQSFRWWLYSKGYRNHYK
nr:uncharacterized protein LOC111504690 [Leptinotarsa decemlineata]